MLSEEEIKQAKITADDLIKSCGNDKEKAIEVATYQLFDSYSRFEFMREVKLNIEKWKIIK